MGMHQLLNGCPTNIKEPNFGRWGTITAVARVVKRHWLPLFYMAENVKATEKSGCYLHTIATKLMDLMNSRSDPKQIFLERYESTINKYTSKWRSMETLPIILAGDAIIAKWFLKKLFHHGTVIPDEEVSLPNHYMGGSTPKLNLRECINWLIQEVDLEKLQDQRLIQMMINDLAIVADSESVIDLLDPSTWGEHDFSRSLAIIWNEIATRAAHQQRVENLVQTAGFLGQTHVEEARRLAWAKIHCIFYRDFKIWALDSLRKEEEAKKQKRRQREQRRRQQRSQEQSSPLQSHI